MFPVLLYIVKLFNQYITVAFAPHFCFFLFCFRSINGLVKILETQRSRYQIGQYYWYQILFYRHYFDKAYIMICQLCTCIGACIAFQCAHVFKEVQNDCSDQRTRYYSGIQYKGFHLSWFFFSFIFFKTIFSKIVFLCFCITVQLKAKSCFTPQQVTLAANI